MVTTRPTIKSSPELREGVALAVKTACGFTNLAKALGISTPAIRQWDKVPAERVHEVEAITGVPRSLLRPDLYPAHRERLPGAVPDATSHRPNHSP